MRATVYGEALAREYSKKQGIYKILVDTKSGHLKPGDDLLFILVAGDIREHVKPVLSELLDRRVIEFADRVVAAYWQLGDDIWTRYDEQW